MVWKFAAELHQPQTIIIDNIDLTDLDWVFNRKWKSATPFPRKLINQTPALLLACRDARDAALKVYRPAFERELGHPAYFNFTKDALCFTNWVVYNDFIMQQVLLGRRDRDDVLYIWMLFLEPDFVLSTHAQANICIDFPQLKLLRVVDEDDAFFNALRYPINVATQDEILESFLPFGWDTTFFNEYNRARQIDLPNFVAPRIERGTVAQWQRELTSD